MRTARAGFTIIELLCVLAVVGIAASLAVPAMTSQVERLRVRAALDLLTSHVARGRMLAVREAVRVRLRFEPATGCARAYVLSRAADGATLDSVPLSLEHRSVCLHANLPQPLVFDSRGMLVGSPRMIYGRAGSRKDSISVSIAGRIYRWY
jgi:prepilin-type N-terminal cleavage/methylation domain-containing protein